MTTAPLRMRSGLLTKSLRSRTRSGDANLEAELLKSRELKSGSEPVGLWKQLKRCTILLTLLYKHSDADERLLKLQITEPATVRLIWVRGCCAESSESLSLLGQNCILVSKDCS